MNHVFLNHGRWVAECDAGCGGAEKLHGDGLIQQASDGTRYGITRSGLMICGSCGWQSRVEWPDAVTVAAVTTLTAARMPINRNWAPGEPVELLVAENIEHGLAVA